MQRFEPNDYNHLNVSQQILKIQLFTMELDQHIHQKQYSPQPTKDHFKPQINFYDEFCKLFLANKILTAQLEELTNQNALLLSRLSKLEKKEHADENLESSHEDKKKRVRRMASQIQRHYQCRVAGCGKSYGSEGSLNQHVKFKHPQLFIQMTRIGSSNVKEQEDNDSQPRHPTS